MVKKFYQVQKFKEKKSAKALMKNKPVSLKYSLEVISHLKGKRVDKSLAFLNRILRREEFLPLRVYIQNTGHRKGASKYGSKIGRYPVRVVKAFIELLESVKANADYKGLDSENLLISHMFASQGFQRISNQSQGRISGKRRKRKSAHLEVVVMEAR